MAIASEALNVPTRAEVDDAYREIQELKRELRRMRKSSGCCRGAAARRAGRRAVAAALRRATTAHGPRRGAGRKRASHGARKRGGQPMAHRAPSEPPSLAALPIRITPKRCCASCSR